MTIRRVRGEAGFSFVVEMPSETAREKIICNDGNLEDS